MGLLGQAANITRRSASHFRASSSVSKKAIRFAGSARSSAAVAIFISLAGQRPGTSRAEASMPHRLTARRRRGGVRRGRLGELFGERRVVAVAEDQGGRVVVVLPPVLDDAA